MIRSIKIDGLPGALNGSLELTYIGSVTSLVGPNSSGKTTVAERCFHSCTSLATKEPIGTTPHGPTDWYGWERAAISFEYPPNAQAVVDPVTLDASLLTKVEVEVSCLNDKAFVLTRINTGEQNLQVADPTAPFTDTTAQIEHLENEISTRLDQIQKLRGKIKTLNDQFVQPNVKHLTDQQKKKLEGALAPTKTPNFEKLKSQTAPHEEKIKTLDNQIKGLQANLEAAKNATMQFVDHATGETRDIPVASLRTFMESLNPPSVKHIRFREFASESIETLLNDAVNSKKGQDSSLYEQARDHLTALLEAKVDVFEEGDKRSLTSDNVDWSNLSTGAQVCLRYFALTHELDSNAFIIWDEPENGLHATRRAKLMEIFRNDSRQLFIATHATEFCGVLDKDCEVYRFFAQLTDGGVRFQIEHSTNRRHGFQIAEDLGLNPSSTLFTANVVLWVEGPSDMLFWRHWINESADEHGLLEGFDYTIMMYGGQNISHIELEDDQGEGMLGFDLLALCRHAIVIADADQATAPAGELYDALKDATKAIKEAVDKLNGERTNAAMFFVTGGREVENYLSDEAIRYALLEIGNFSDEQTAKLDLDNLTLGQWEHYYDAIEQHLVANQVTRKEKGKDNQVAAQRSKWGSKNKVEFMRTALQCPALAVDQLKFGADERIKEVTSWIVQRRQR